MLSEKKPQLPLMSRYRHCLLAGSISSAYLMVSDTHGQFQTQAHRMYFFNCEISNFHCFHDRGLFVTIRGDMRHDPAPLNRVGACFACSARISGHCSVMVLTFSLGIDRSSGAWSPDSSNFHGASAASAHVVPQ